MTPTAFYCTQQCVFCWRAQSTDLKTSWNETKMSKWDSPEKIVEASIQAQLAILTGYRGNPKTNSKKLKEAHDPKHVAISLTGEPTLYEPIGELIQLFHKKDFTTFLVSNGTVPSALANLVEEPTQLYVSVCAPNREIFKQTCRPQIPDAWQKLNDTLALLSSFKCATVMRMTLVRGLNTKNLEGYARLVEKAKPTYIEAKAYMHVGFSRLRLGYESMPSHSNVREFASQLTSRTGYNSIDESMESRVVLLSKLSHSKRYDVD